MRSLQIDYFLLIDRLSPLAPAPHPPTYLHTSVTTDTHTHACCRWPFLQPLPSEMLLTQISSLWTQISELLELLTSRGTLQSPLRKCGPMGHRKAGSWVVSQGLGSHQPHSNSCSVLTLRVPGQVTAFQCLRFVVCIEVVMMSHHRVKVISKEDSMIDVSRRWLDL